MLRPLIGAALLAGIACPAGAHAIFPGSQTVRTAGERAFVTVHALNGRKDVSEFVVEVFEYHSWAPYRLAVARPERLTVPFQSDDASEAAADRSISVLVDLDGERRRHLRICTKSVARRDAFRSRTTEIATRVCANVMVERF